MRRSLRRRWVMVGVVTSALVATLLVVPVVTPGGLDGADAATGPVSGAIGLGGGLSGSVDERTGLFSVSVPVVSVGGPGSAGVSWSLVWDQARAAGGLDRSGFGAGWSLGVSYVDTGTPKRVYPANGGSYLVGGTFSSHLQDYPLKDLVFAETSGATPYTLTYDDGRVDAFDANGNLATRTDRFGNRTQLTWRSMGDQRWAPATIVDGYGQTTTFSYTPSVNPTTIVVTAPPRSDGVPVATTITLGVDRRVATVQDPINGTARFRYGPFSGQTFLTQVTSPTLAQTYVAYQDIAYQSGLTAVRSVVTTDAADKVLGPARYFVMNPLASAATQNYTGYPNHVGGESDLLFESGDRNYQYTTALSGCVVDRVPAPPACATPQSTTQSTYDSKHRMVTRNVYAGRTLVQTHSSTYPPVQTVPVPANYARALTSSILYLARSSSAGIASAQGQRTAARSSAYDDHGRVVSATDETGTTTVTAYDGTYGLITSETITGKDGSRRQTTHVLTADKKSISSATTAYAAPGQPLSAQVTTSYLYDDQGQPSQRTMTWAPGAKPAGNSGGPDTVVTKFASAVDTSAHTRTITTTTAVGTPEAASSQSVIDLVTGGVMRNVDPLGRVTTYGYDAGGRQTSLTTADGMTTRRVYALATTGTTASRTDSTPDGHIVLTAYDALGRQTRVTDNVKNQAFTSSPTSRQISAFGYSVDGSQITTTDQLGRTVTTTFDTLGRQVQQVGVTGITKSSAYDDAAHTVVQSTTGAGATAPTVTRTTAYDNGNRPTSVTRQYSDDSTDPPMGRTYDGLGRLTSQTSDDLTLGVSYLGSGGTTTEQTVTPQSTKAFPGSPLALSRTVALGDQPTSSEREQTLLGNGNGNGKRADAAPAQGTRMTYDPAGQMATSTDPDGRTTSYTYYADGTVATRTSPAGIVTTDHYDATSGRLTSVTAKPPGQTASTTSYTYIPAGQPGAGEIHTIADGTATVTLGYDADHHLVSRSYSDGTATSAAYQDNGLLASGTDVTGAVTTYGYDGSGRITSATQKRGGTELASVGYTYDAFSRVATTKRGNGVTTTNSFNAHNQLTGQVTTSASGARLETHGYTYDTHGNVATRLDTVPTVSATPTTAGSWLTAYRYDAYDRLVGSATYAGATAGGQPATTTTYTLNVAGDILAASTTTRTQGGAQRQDAPAKGKKDDNPGKGPKLPNPPNVGSPPPYTSTVTNTIDPAGQLTAQSTDGTTVSQAFDGDGRTTRSLGGTVMTYDAYDRMLTATTKAGTTATYAYWPDGTRRSTTTSGAGGSSTQTFHYSADGSLVNDTTADATTGSGAATASYLMTAGREARTLQPGTTGTGSVPAGAPAPVVTGTGTGYLLRDRHSSVTALVDAAGAVTNSYEYTDYGAAAQQDGQPLAAPAVVAGGRSNPFQYVGAATTSSMTDATTGLLLLPARSYDPAQARFTSRDTANVFNHYQGFNTNPIRLVDVTGHDATTDLVLDIALVLGFIIGVILTVLSAGAAVALAAPLVLSEGITWGTAGVLVSAVASVASAASALTGLATSTARVADDIDSAVNHQHFFSTSVRTTLGLITYAAGAVSVVTGLANAGITSTYGIAEEAEESTEEGTEEGSEEGGLFRAEGSSVDDLEASTENDEVSYSRRHQNELGYNIDTILGNRPHPSFDAPESQGEPNVRIDDAEGGVDRGGNEVTQGGARQMDHGAQSEVSQDQRIPRRVLGTAKPTEADVAVSNRDPDLGKALTSSQEAMGGMSGETSENVPANLKAANLSALGLELRFGKVGADEVEDFLANDAFEGSITDDE